jgi:hypothetical protein
MVPVHPVGGLGYGCGRAQPLASTSRAPWASTSRALGERVAGSLGEHAGPMGERVGCALNEPVVDP